MISDYELGVYAAATYGRADLGVSEVAWDAQNDVTSGVNWYLKYIEGGTIVAFEGTHDLPDWERDFAALPITIAAVGLVHPGFFFGMPEVWMTIKPLIQGNLYVCGHSLGAAHATLFAALAVRDGIKPARRVVLGEPRPGGAGLSDLLRDVPSASYCTVSGIRRDFVTCVPLALPDFAYQHPTVVTDLPAAITPEAENAYGELFACHYPPVYLAALQDRASMPSAA
jgi:hypothetical protein